MRWMLILMVAALSTVPGLLTVGFLANACVRWYRISSMEGNSGYFVIGLALLGAILGFLIGLVTTLVVTGEGPVNFAVSFGYACAVILVLSGLAAWICRAVAHIPPAWDGRELQVHVEVKLPVGTDVSGANPENSKIEMQCLLHGQLAYGRPGTFDLEHLREEGQRWIVPGTMDLDTERGQRAFSFSFAGRQYDGFLLSIPGRPGRELAEWSPWRPVSLAGQPWPDSKPSYRFRLQPVPEPEPMPTEEERFAEKKAAEAAAFAALTPDSLIEHWLPYTTYGAPEEQLERAIQNIAARPAWVAELSALILGDNRELAKEALRLIQHLKQPPAGLIPAVTEYGQRLAEEIKVMNATPEAEDPSYEKAAEISPKFSAWMDAVETLRGRSGADLLPELKTILTLARVRTESHVMRMDVVRVASYYLHQWGGVAPLPSDPPPR